MAPGETVTVGLGVNQIPLGATLGSQYLLMLLDETNNIAERLENNNAVASAIDITSACGNGPQTATFDTALQVPKCALVGNSCSSGTLLDGRHVKGPEPNQPNSLNACADGTFGTYHVDESVDLIKVSTTDGSDFAAGRTVEIEATVWAWASPTTDHLDLYYAADANNPTWVYLTTLTASVVGEQTLSATYVLPSGSLQAVRANFRYLGSASSCTVGGYNDHDDLVFAVK